MSALGHELPFRSWISRSLMVRFNPDNRPSLVVRFQSGMVVAGCVLVELMVSDPEVRKLDKQGLMNLYQRLLQKPGEADAA